MEGKSKRKIILGTAAVAITAAVFAIGYLGFQGWPESAPASMPVERDIAGVYALQFADTPEKRAKGLSGVEYLPQDEVLLFIHNSDSNCSVWMKNMRFNIDVVWLNGEFSVIEFLEDLSPHTYPRIFSPASLCRYFIEANNGFVKANGIEKGSRVFVDFANALLKI